MPTIRLQQSLRMHLSRGFKANVLLALWHFLPRESTLVALLRTGRRLLLALLSLCLVPRQQMLSRRPMPLRLLNACWLLVALTHLTRTMHYKELLSFWVMWCSEIRLERPLHRPLHTSLSKVLTCALFQAMTLVPFLLLLSVREFHMPTVG